ncbi:oxalate/formate MFS antiporter [Alicyclobacillus macrosporangiidus]|uniref:oxalate/formate MFS antiporter n=1 Tax=Alicyclobacillus macrosporangiidus TaxID=392015 RepID=UPI000495CC69|nr:oxalate/formate MFS antiporter [Alicyclobacillus macrosporangiidus]
MKESRTTIGSTRWVQLVLGIVCMMAISSPQYTWTLFVGDLQSRFDVGLTVLQVTFTLLVVVQTWFSPVQAYLIEHFGPRRLIAFGGVLTGFSWVLAAFAQSVFALYLSYGVMGGLGTGIVYVGIVGLMVRWFPDRRGLASGLVAAGYGMGAILTTFPITHSLKAYGYASTLVWFGVVQGMVVLVAAQGLKKPPTTSVVSDKRDRGDAQEVSFATDTHDMSHPPQVVLRTPLFWLMFLMMSLLSTSGLMITSEVGPFAKDFGVSGALVFGMSALPLSLTLSRLANGLTRPFFGWVSDRIGREATMTLAFTLEAGAILLLLGLRNHPVAFVLLTSLAFFGWGEIFSLFPATLTDTFGPRYATQNYGFLYIAQGIGSLLGGPFSAYLREVTGSWTPVFLLVASLDLLTAFLAFVVLRPARARWAQRTTGSRSLPVRMEGVEG